MFRIKKNTFEWVLLLVPFICWFYCFRHFFTGSLWLQADAISYADHIGFYTDNLIKGVFPLWDPTWSGGAPNDFFLRRIGDVNPLLFLIVLLKWLGVSSASAYLVFLGMYYFLAGCAFFLITRLLLADNFFAFIAYILLLFSSWGCEIFYNYIVIIFVPIIWFFYFLLRFSRAPQKRFFLGMCFCLGLVLTTYIPFFFLTILSIFSFLIVVFYRNELIGFLKNSFAFINKNKIFTFLCFVFLLTSCIPALLFYKESKAGEFVLPNRHSGTTVPSALAVSLENVASGDIISHGYFDRLFDDLQHLDMGDIYIPYIFFLILLTTICARVNKLIFFLLFNILALSLITVTSAATVHRFLYDHIIFFKFIRNIYYFFWLAMLPMAILLAVSAFKSLLSAIDGTANKTPWIVYIIACHLLFIVFLFGHQGVLKGAWVAVGASLLYFLVYFFYGTKVSYPAGFLLIFLAVCIQSSQVYSALNDNLFQIQKGSVRVEQTHLDLNKKGTDLYYASTWFATLANYIDPQVLQDYLSHQFIFYDNVFPYVDSAAFFQSLNQSFTSHANIAFVSKFETEPNNWKNDNNAGLQADYDPVTSQKLLVLRSDANTWVLKTHLSVPQFLVINDNYNKDWHAFINDRPARLLRANFSFKGLWVPSGDSSIVLRFSHPRRYIFHFGLISFFVLVFLYLLVLCAMERI